MIDINSGALSTAFGSGQSIQVRINHGRIVVTPAHTDRIRSERRRTGLEASAFSGAGFLSEAARMAGLHPAFGIEINPEYAALYEANHPSAVMYNCSISDVPIEELLTWRNRIELLTLGIPCEPFSQARTTVRGAVGQKRDVTLPPEAHDVGDMAAWAFLLVALTNPYDVVIEEVPAFLKSASAHQLVRALRRLGYHVEARTLNPLDYGSIAERKRVVIVATTDERVCWPREWRSSLCLGDLLDQSEEVEDQWWDASSKSWVFATSARNEKRGVGFVPHIVDASATRIPTIPKRYWKEQAQNVQVAHPTRPGTRRWLTIKEALRLHGVRPDYIVGDRRSVAGEVIGQGVVVNFFQQVIASATGRAPGLHVGAVHAEPDPLEASASSAPQLSMF